MATIKLEEGFKLGQPRPSTINNRLYEYDVILKLLQNQADFNEGITKSKQPQKQHWRLNPKKERRVKKK